MKNIIQTITAGLAVVIMLLFSPVYVAAVIAGATVSGAKKAYKFGQGLI
jgi:hypothetical protein